MRRTSKAATDSASGNAMTPPRVPNMHAQTRPGPGQRHQHHASVANGDARHSRRTIRQQLEFGAAEDLQRDANRQRHVGAIGRQSQQPLRHQHLVGRHADPAAADRIILQ